jgi:uncharacterized membrane protein YiaA
MLVAFDASTSASISDFVSFVWLFFGIVVFSVGVFLALTIFRR